MLKHLQSLHGLASVLSILAFSIVAFAASAQNSSAGKNQITFTSWVGPYMRSQMLGFVRPYEEQNGVRVNVSSYNGGISEIRDQVDLLMLPGM